jgi:hypothetical protein
MGVYDAGVIIACINKLYSDNKCYCLFVQLKYNCVPTTGKQFVGKRLKPVVKPAPIYKTAKRVIVTLAPHLIAFFGPDGTGKSTHVDLLVSHFKANKTKVKKIWIRSPHTLAYLLSRILMGIGFSKRISNPYGKQTTIPAVDKNRGLRFIWPWIELTSVIPLVLIRVYIPLHLGYTIVAERYVVDTVVTIAYFVDDLSFLHSRIARLLLHLAPKNTVFIHLDSTYSALMKRRNRLVEPYGYIRFQKIGYDAIGNSMGVKCINTSSLSINQVSSQIMAWLGTYQFSVNQAVEVVN